MHLGYTVIYVENVQKTVEFYEAAFGLTRRLIKPSGQYAEMETGATTLAFSQENLMAADYPMLPNRPDEKPCGAEIAFFTDDVPQAYDRAIKAGAVSHVTPHIKPWGQSMAHVRDNNGFLIEFCTPPAP